MLLIQNFKNHIVYLFESSINNNLGQIEIKFEISNYTFEIIKLNLNDDIFSKINDVFDK